MTLLDLKNSLKEHSGVFHCAGRGDRGAAFKDVHFEHVYDPPDPAKPVSGIPNLGMLREFYETFGSLTLYLHKESGDAAFYIAKPNEWDGFLECLRDWTDFDDQPELLPDWLDNCITIGEIPKSGNYLLVPTTGEKAGHIVEFEHDGFEFIDHASNLIDFVIKMLEPDSEALTHMAAHMSFSEGDPWDQWWIEEMCDNKGFVVKTQV